MSVRSRVKQTLASVGYYRQSLARSPYDGVAVLAYHGVRDNTLPDGAMRFEGLHVRAARLDEHCAALRDLGCAALSLATYRDIAARRQLAPFASVMLTFDDGYRSLLTHALPVLEKYGFPAVVFVCTDPVERQVRFWFDALAEREGEETAAEAKGLDHVSWRALTDRAEMPADRNDPHSPLTVDELRRLASHPLITIAVHTRSHPILRWAPLSVQKDEIRGSRADLETWLGVPLTAFAYPNGRPGLDYDSQTIDIIRQLGFECAFTTGERFSTPSHAPFEQPRFTMLQDISGAELAHRLAVSWPRSAAHAS